MPVDPKQIAKRRHKLKLTLQQAAESAGWGSGPAGLSKWATLERQPDDPPLSVAETVARVLNCGVDELLVREKGKP
jgi:transcriptional regulator with XRE-family HTH domain